MQVDSLKFLAEQGVQAGPRVIELPGEPRGRYGLIKDSTGGVEIITPEGETVHSNAYDIDTLCRVVKEQHGLTECEIWYGREGIIGVFDATRPDLATCFLSLSPSPQLEMLMRWDASKGVILSQAELVTLLRTMFDGVAPSDLLPAVRGVKATKGAEVSQQISQGKVSMSRQVVVEMTGAAAIPEQVTFFVPMFAQHAVQDSQLIRIDVEPVPEQERFRLIVLPGQIEKAQAEAEKTIFDSIVKALGNGNTISVFRGKP